MRTPKLCHHKGQEKGYITIYGKEQYFKGHWPRDQKDPPPEIVHQYELARAEIVITRATQPKHVGPQPSIDELWLGYEAFAQSYYTRGQRSEVSCIRSACSLLAKTYGAEKAADFSPKKLKIVRAIMAEKGWTRRYINDQVGRIRAMFRWAVAEELVPETVYRALRAIRDLRKGEIDGLKEQNEVPPVPDEVLEMTIPHLPDMLQKIVRVHRLIGCRIDEVCAMKPSEIERGDLWKFTPTHSKNFAHYWIGPKAQEILLPLLEQAGEDDYLFPSKIKGKKHYSTSRYRHKVAEVCKEHGIPHWSPLQIRHAAGQEARDRHARGLEATQARLNHKSLNISQVYANQMETLAKEVARLYG